MDRRKFLKLGSLASALIGGGKLVTFDENMKPTQEPDIRTLTESAIGSGVTNYGWTASYMVATSRGWPGGKL